MRVLYIYAKNLSIPFIPASLAVLLDRASRFQAVASLRCVLHTKTSFLCLLAQELFCTPFSFEAAVVSSLLDSCWSSRRNVFLFDARTTRPRCFHAGFCKLRQPFLYIKFKLWTSIYLRFNAISFVLLSLPRRVLSLVFPLLSNVSCFDAERRRNFFSPEEPNDPQKEAKQR